MALVLSSSNGDMYVPRDSAYCTLEAEHGIEELHRHEEAFRIQQQVHEQAIKILEMEEDNEELKKLAEEYEKLANTDKLTELNTRRGFFEKHLPEANWYGEKVTAFHIDFDKFKSINDNLGHDEGDSVICLYTDAMKEVFTGDDFLLVRLGGDEFAVLGKGELSDEKIAEKMNAFGNLMREKAGKFSEKHEFKGMAPLTASIGVYAGETLTEENIDAIIHHSDKAGGIAKGEKLDMKDQRNHYAIHHSGGNVRDISRFVFDKQTYEDIQENPDAIFDLSNSRNEREKILEKEKERIIEYYEALQEMIRPLLEGFVIDDPSKKSKLLIEAGIRRNEIDQEYADIIDLLEGEKKIGVRVNGEERRENRREGGRRAED